MTLLDYLRTLKKDERLKLAGELKTTLAQVNHIAYGARKANVLMAVRINRISKGKVSLDSLRPDLNWKDLRDDLNAAA